MLQHIHDQAEDLGQAASLKAQLRDLRDDMDLKETLLKSAKESESRHANDLATLKEKLSRSEEELAQEREKNVVLNTEKLKLECEVSHLKVKVDFDSSAITASKRRLLNFREFRLSFRSGQAGGGL
jgi:chromosome segregation ATPase